MQHACFVFGEVPDSNLGSDTTFLISSKDMLGTSTSKSVMTDRFLPYYFHSLPLSSYIRIDG